MTEIERFRALMRSIDAAELTVEDRDALLDLLRAALDAAKTGDRKGPRHAMPEMQF